MTSGLDKRQIQQDVESRVKNWLKSTGVFYLENAKSSVLGSAVIDFLVTQPFPMAIEVLWADPKVWSKQAKRILAQRINIAQQYGRYIPVVAVVSKAHIQDNGQDFSEWKELPFFDAVIDAEKLPDLWNLRENLQLNPLTQEILEKGKPHNYRLTSPDEVPSIWSESLTIEDLVRPENFPKGTIAEGIQRRLLKFCQSEGIQIIEDTRKSIVGTIVVGYQIPKMDRHKLFRVLDEALQDEVGKKLGGNFEKPAINLDFKEFGSYQIPRLSGIVWNAPDNRRVAIRWITASEPHFRDKARELLAEAWMLRSLLEHPVDQVLLLLNPGNESTPSPYLVNVLESSGIIVLPWDFAESIPLFMQYLWQGEDSLGWKRQVL